MKNYADLGECYPPQPLASAHNTLLDLHDFHIIREPDSIIEK